MAAKTFASFTNFSAFASRASSSDWPSNIPPPRKPSRSPTSTRARQQKLSDSEQALYLLVLGASLPAIEADSVTESVLLRSVPFILDPDDYTMSETLGTNARSIRGVLRLPPAPLPLSPLPPSIVQASARIADKPS